MSTRCHELGIACIEQVRSQGRPPKARLVEPTRPESPPKAGGADGGASVGSRAGEAAASRKRPHEGSSRSSNHPSEYPVRALASLLYNGFGAFRAAGQVQTEKATSIL